MSDDTPVKNTDRELWRETKGDYYAPSIHVTEQGGIGINVGGMAYVKSLREWHKLAAPPASHRHPLAARLVSDLRIEEHRLRKLGANHTADILQRAHARIEQHDTQPAAQGDSAQIERAAKAIYESYRFGAPENYPWQEHGNSLKQDAARDYARTALATLSHPPQPVTPVEAKMTDGMVEHVGRGLYIYWDDKTRLKYSEKVRKVLESMPVDAQGDGGKS